MILFVAVVVGLLGLRLFYIQVIDGSYKRAAENNVLRSEVLNPPRGEVYDRNGEFLLQSVATYDLMVVPRNTAPFDTLTLSRITGTSVEKIRKEMRNAAVYSSMRPSVVIKQLSQEQKLLFDEYSFPGFYTTYRTSRSYPRKIAGNLLGYISEVSDDDIARDNYYRPGDYVGKSGIERAYEDILRGEKGLQVEIVDVHGISKGSYKDGAEDVSTKYGTSITCTLDAELQAFGEELMRGKVGSIIAIEPSTGEILVMVSSPTYDPDELVGRDRGNNYIKLLYNKRQPLFNRAVMASYPPGSTFKLVNGLIGLQEGVLVPSQLYPCHGGYTIGRGVKCHNHFSPLNLQEAIQTSCNAYFCYVFRSIIDNKAYGSVKVGLDVWGDYVRSFGFGRKLDSDFQGERNGLVPSTDLYNKRYRGSWNSLTVISLSIGQGELGCTPLQMGNLAATIANRGYYYPPHVVKRIHDRDSIDARFYVPHRTMVDERHFETIIKGMYDAVHKPGGTALVARVDKLDICGKTGTAQNSHGDDHSTFLCFAPRQNPKIAISVYVENGRFGASAAAPIASLLIEKYLTGEVKRPDLVNRIKTMPISYPSYDR